MLIDLKVGISAEISWRYAPLWGRLDAHSIAFETTINFRKKRWFAFLWLILTGHMLMTRFSPIIKALLLILVGGRDVRYGK